MSKRRSLSGLRSKKRDYFATYGEKITERDFPLVKERILSASIADEWDEARREWEFKKMLHQDDYDTFEEFVEKCELCNQGGLKINFQINNFGTGKKYLVGSTCIKKFLILKGADNQEQSAAMFDFQVKKMLASKELHKILPSILTSPTQYEALRFRNASKEILGTLDNILITQGAWNEYLVLLFGTNKPGKALNHVRTVLFEPSKMRYKKVTDLSTGEEEGRWANKMRVKTRAETTLVRSKENRPDKHY